jgi:hypothetical protein
MSCIATDERRHDERQHAERLHQRRAAELEAHREVGEGHRDQRRDADAPHAHVEAVPERLMHQGDVKERGEMRQREAARAVREGDVDDGDDRDDQEDGEKCADGERDRRLRPGVSHRRQETADERR